MKIAMVILFLLPLRVLAADGGLARNPVVLMADGTVKPLLVKIGRTTTIQLVDPSEHILDVVPGDKVHFKVVGSGGANFAYVQPKATAKGRTTNLHLVTQSSHDYVFDIREVSEDGGKAQDIVLVKYEAPEATVAKAPAVCDPNLESEFHQSQNLLKQTESAYEASQAEATKAKAEAATKVDPAKFVASLHHDYHISAKLREAPFNVTDVWRDERFTYVSTTAQVKAALYSGMDGKPEMVEYSFKDGVYTVPRILDYGYLQLGKKGGKNYSFKRKGE